MSSTVQIPHVGCPAPKFEGTAIVNNVFEEISLEKYAGQWVLLCFIPMAFTFVCPTEIVAFSEAAEEFKSRNCQVIYASTDSEHVLLRWAQEPRSTGGLGACQIPLLSDRSLRTSRAYGVLKEDEGVDYRGLFLIDPKGVLRHITINDMPVGRSVVEALRVLDAFQFTDQYGEVCPANWQKGEKTIDTHNAKKYFNTLGN